MNPRDALHEAAARLHSRFSFTQIVTSEMVLTEVMNHFSASGDCLRRAAWALVESLCENPRCQVVPQTSGQFRNAARLYGLHHDKQWSLTDCSSILIMRSKDINDALTYDKHFEQAGFTALLRD